MSASSTKTTAQSRILRTMGVFSGVRVVGILCSLVRNKLIAWLVGPAGLGLVILYNSVIDLISQATRLSIDHSVQRDISQSTGEKVAETVTVVRKWSLWLGFAGTAAMCVLSPLLSLWTFETFDRWYVFCLLSVVPFFTTYSVCVTAQNQGLRRFRQLASANITGVVAGLFVSVPLIVWLRIDSIEWIILTYGLAMFTASFVFRPRVKSVRMEMREVIGRGRTFISLGAQITLAIFVGQAFTYLFVLYLNTYGDTEVVGIYQSGFTLMNSYIGIIYTALFIEYYPRLAANAHSPRRLSIAASHEARLTLLIITPLLCLLIALAEPVVKIIYSGYFVAIVPYIVFASVGVVLRTTSWCLAYVVLARGEGRKFLTIETLSAIIGFGLNVGGYMWKGYAGIGAATIAWYAVYTLILAAVCRRVKVVYDRKTILVTAGSLLTLSTVAAVYLWLSY